MRQPANKTISHYRILEAVAEGRRGGVYKARDTRLNRLVAIRLLPPAETASGECKERFVAEVRAASRLNHPNIATIYEIGRDEDANFIAMEYVAGQTLEKLIPRKGLPLEESLNYAAQIAGALAAAHAAGVIHRDLHPSKVMVTESGLVKVLDFGLAMLAGHGEAADARECCAGSGSETKTDEAPTVELAVYRAPEQAAGQPADARSDIFSFGALLHEMTTGQRSFPDHRGVLEDPTRRELDKLVGRCLRQDPRERFQMMEDLKLMLEDLREECASPRQQSVAAHPTRRAASWKSPGVLVSFLVLMAAGSTLTWWLTRAEQAPPGLTHRAKLTRLTKDSSLAVTPALSPDGKLIAYASDRASEAGLDIWVQQVSGGSAVRLTEDQAAEYAPAFSPDGSRIVFRSDREGGGLYVVPALGGHATQVAKGGQRPRFSPDGGMIAYYAGPQGSYSGTRLYVVPAAGGEPRRLQPSFRAAASPIWTPDGKHLLFVGTDPTDAWDWWVVAIDGGSINSTGAREVFQRQGLSGGPPGPDAWVDGNHVIFTAAQGDGTNLWRVAISPKSWKIAGPAERVTFGTGELQAYDGTRGRLVFTSGSNNIDVWSLPAEPGRADREPQRLTTSAAGDYSCDISRDGKMLVFRSDRSERVDVWSKDLEAGVERALTASADFESLPKIAPDGSKAAFAVRETGASSGNASWVIDVVPATGGLPQKICQGCGPPLSWSADGRKIVYVKRAGSGSALRVLDTVSGNDRLLAQHPDIAVINAARLSPDDRWLACKGDLDMRRSVILLVPLHEWSAAPAGNWIAVTEGNSWDDVPRWSADGNQVYFISDRDGFRCIWARRLERSSKKPIGPPFAVRHFHQWRLSLVSNLALIELAVARDKLVFPLQEQTGSIWMLEPRE